MKSVSYLNINLTTQQIMMVLLFCSCFCGTVKTKNTYEDRPTELRVLIDVSKSMAEHDPENLRAASMLMLARVLPTGTKVGVWMFAKTVQKLMSVDKVTPNWIDVAKKAIEQINSEGEYTNLAEALEVGSIGWVAPDFYLERNIVLLTDGFVDVSEYDKVNQESKAHILNTLVPNFKRLDIAVHTIALSDEADKRLLQDIAYQTGGLFFQLQDINQVQSAFLDILDKAVVPNSVPINENRFKVDGFIEEANILVMKQAKKSIGQTEFLRLRLPSGLQFENNNLPANIQWYEEGLVDLISIQQPEVGEWSVVGNIDTAHRVLILSEVGLETNDLPAYMFVGESLEMRAKLKANEIITNNSGFLPFVDINARIIAQQEEFTDFISEYKLNRSHREQENAYQTVVGPLHLSAPQDLTIQTIVKAKTFVRQKQQSIKLLPLPFSLDANIEVNETEEKNLSIKVYPDLSVVEANDLFFTVDITDNFNKNMVFDLKHTEGDIWHLRMQPLPEITEYKFHIKVAGKTKDGRKFSLKTQNMLLPVPVIHVPAPKTIIKEVPVFIESKQETPQDLTESDTTTDSKQSKHKSTNTSIDTKQQDDDSFPWVSIVGIIICNVLFAGGIMFLVVYLRKKGSNAIEDITSKIQ